MVGTCNILRGLANLGSPDIRLALLANELDPIGLLTAGDTLFSGEGKAKCVSVILRSMLQWMQPRLSGIPEKDCLILKGYEAGKSIIQNLLHEFGTELEAESTSVLCQNSTSDLQSRVNSGLDQPATTTRSSVLLSLPSTKQKKEHRQAVTVPEAVISGSSVKLDGGVGKKGRGSGGVKVKAPSKSGKSVDVRGKSKSGGTLRAREPKGEGCLVECSPFLDELGAAEALQAIGTLDPSFLDSPTVVKTVHTEGHICATCSKLEEFALSGRFGVTKTRLEKFKVLTHLFNHGNGSGYYINPVRLDWLTKFEGSRKLEAWLGYWPKLDAGMRLEE